MKSSTIILIFLLVISCKNSEEKIKISVSKEDCIKNIIQKDSILGGIRNHASEKISLSKTITNYTNVLKVLDFTNCPETFELAFKNHIEAWLSVKNVSDDYPSLRGELHDIFDQLEKSKDSTEFKLYVKEIWDTWKKIEESYK